MIFKLISSVLNLTKDSASTFATGDRSVVELFLGRSCICKSALVCKWCGLHGECIMKQVMSWMEFPECRVIFLR